MAKSLKQKIGQGCALALFQSYQKDSALLKGIYQELSKWMEIFEQFPLLIRCFRSPVLSVVDKQQIIDEVFQAKMSRPFMVLLIERNLIGCLDAVIKNFQLLYRTYFQVIHIEVKVDTLDSSIEKKLDHFFEKAFAGYERNVSFSKADDLYGGFVVQAGNFYWDCSLKGKLNALRVSIGK